MPSERPTEGVPRRKRLNKSMDTLFPQSSTDRCRVCDEPVVDGRWNYCSERCRDIAQSVQKMFIWDSVRERVLQRDDHTCQECGLSKEMAYTAHWNVHHDLRDRANHLRSEDFDAWRDRLEELESRYNMPLYTSFEVDHITRIADGGHPFDEDNLRTLCQSCHAEKTAQENSAEHRPNDLSLQDYIES